MRSASIPAPGGARGVLLTSAPNLNGGISARLKADWVALQAGRPSREGGNPAGPAARQVDARFAVGPGSRAS
ncbi:hypothetical protein SBV1_1170024 [Verrucomicrobia bacterium]|nr:hypothetical protein SBV1_1170024 [Verrucomicrobiota bacterium]